MFLLRGTKKLLARLQVAPAKEPPAGTNLLGDWYANTLNIGSERMVLCVSATTLLPVIVPLAGGTLPGKLKAALRETLTEIGVPHPALEAELATMNEVTVTTTASRSVLGSMNDFEHMASVIRLDVTTLLELGLTLAKTPCSPIDYERPMDAVRSVFGLDTVPLRAPPPRLYLAPQPPDLDALVAQVVSGVADQKECRRRWAKRIRTSVRFPYSTWDGDECLEVETVTLRDGVVTAFVTCGEDRCNLPLAEVPVPEELPEGGEWLLAYAQWCEAQPS